MRREKDVGLSLSSSSSFLLLGKNESPRLCRRGRRSLLRSASAKDELFFLLLQFFFLFDADADTRSVRTALGAVRRPVRLRDDDSVVLHRESILHQLPEGVLLRGERRERFERTLCFTADKFVLSRARDGGGVLFLPGVGEDFGIFETERRRRGRDAVGVWERRAGYFRADRRAERFEFERGNGWDTVGVRGSLRCRYVYCVRRVSVRGSSRAGIKFEREAAEKREKSRRIRRGR